MEIGSNRLCKSIMFACMLWATPLYAAFDVDWLTAQQNPDGSYATVNDVATAFQATAESLRSFHLLEETNPPGIPAALSFINAESFHSTENLTRKIIANANAGADVSELLAELVVTQNPDGGFGVLAGFQSTPLETAFALKAMAAAGLDQSNAINAAISYITSSQHSDGSYSSSVGNESSVYITALVSQALQRFLFTGGAPQVIDAANACLLANQVSAGGWVSDWETALALLAIVPVTADATRYATALDALRARQLANGSWGNDVYATALALRVLHLVENIKFPPDPGGGTISGRVVDGSTGLPLAGVTVSLAQLAGARVDTGLDGSFTLTGVIPNDYTVNYDAAGYASDMRNATVVSGQLIDLGTVRLNVLTGAGFITGVLSDATTGQPIAGAMVQTSGTTAISATSDATGFYRIVTTPGLTTLTASAIGFDTVTASGNVVAGASLIFSPALYPTGTTPPGQGVTLQGRVVDADLQQPLESVTVMLIGGGISTVSDASGAFSLSGLIAGELLVELSKTGFQTVRLTVLAAGSAVNLGTISLPSLDIPLTTTVVGTVTDNDTREPIANATVTVEASGLSATTNAEGAYRIEGILPLSFDLAVSSAGYLSSTQRINLTEPVTRKIDVALTSASVGGITITNLSTDQSSYPALSPVTITATVVNSGSVTRSLQLFAVVSDSAGNPVDRFLVTNGSASPGGIPEPLELQPGASHDIQALWDTNRFVPGYYNITLQAFNSASNQLMAERATGIDIQITQEITRITLLATPRFTNVGATEQITVNAQILNRSNVINDVTIFYTWRSPNGTVLRTAESTVTVQPEETQKLVSIDSFSFGFTESGEHPLELQVLSTPVPDEITGDSIATAPSVRIEPSQTITPETVLPDNDKRIKLKLRLKGVEAQP